MGIREKNMKTYRVGVPSIVWEAWEVDAKNKDEAIRKVLNGEGEFQFQYDTDPMSNIDPAQCVLLTANQKLKARKPNVRNQSL